MFTNNPYAQGGWYNTSNPSITYSGTLGNGSPLPPPILGAPPHSPPPSPLTFHFISSDSTILNCTVIGPDARPYFHIITDSAFTVVQNMEGKIVAIVDWQSQPLIEMEGILPKQRISRWLGLSPDQSCRLMGARGKRYTWAPDGNSICLDMAGLAPSEVLARISRVQRTYTLEMTTKAIQLGLLEVSVVATVLLQSGRNID